MSLGDRTGALLRQGGCPDREVGQEGLPPNPDRVRMTTAQARRSEKVATKQALLSRLGLQYTASSNFGTPCLYAHCTTHSDGSIIWQGGRNGSGRSDWSLGIEETVDRNGAGRSAPNTHTYLRFWLS